MHNVVLLSQIQEGSMPSRGILSLFFSLQLALAVLLSGTVLASEMSPNTRQMWLQNDAVQQRVTQYLDYAKNDKIDAIKVDMQRLPLPQQEAIRFLLLQTMERQQTVISPQLAAYIEQIMTKPPVYQMRHFGDGYEFTTPAFAYPSIANRLLTKWRKNQEVLAFVLAAEREDLHLETWLNDGTPQERQAREKLFIDELDGLSPPALNLIVEQIVDAQNKVIFWLPSNAVMVRLAQVSRDLRVYKLLWRMRATTDSQKELFRVMDRYDDIAIDIVMAATENPTLREEALNYLVAFQPMPGKVRGFLLDQLGSANEQEVINLANKLVRYGYASWLKSLLDSDSKINRRALQKVIGSK
jgi:hypothetical protein